jgi:hypothetical protein
MNNKHTLMTLVIALSLIDYGCNNSTTNQCRTDGGSNKSDAGTHKGGSGHSGSLLGGAGNAGASGSNGAGGSTSSHDAGTNPGDTDGGGSSASIMASNIPASALSFDGLGALELTSADCTIDTDTGEIGCGVKAETYHYQAVDQKSGDRVALFTATSVRIGSSAAVHVHGSLPLVLVARDKMQIFGELSAAGLRDVAVAGGSVETSTGKGGGPGGGGPLLGYSAGGGGSYCGKGGMGNAVGGDMSGAGGPAYGTPELTPLLAGSAGGCGSMFGGGGAGGGAIQLVAGEELTVAITGVVHVGGGGGGAGNNGCGGGSGGALLIEAPSVDIEGILAANGGGGNVFTGGPSGQDGQPSDTAAQGGSTTAGQGSAGSMIDGANGSISGTSNNSSGAGGGGAGRIRINTKSGSATLHGTFSPSATTSCVSQGTL